MELSTEFALLNAISYCSRVCPGERYRMYVDRRVAYVSTASESGPPYPKNPPGSHTQASPQNVGYLSSHNFQYRVELSLAFCTNLCLVGAGSHFESAVKLSTKPSYASG